MPQGGVNPDRAYVQAADSSAGTSAAFVPPSAFTSASAPLKIAEISSVRPPVSMLPSPLMSPGFDGVAEGVASGAVGVLVGVSNPPAVGVADAALVAVAVASAVGVEPGGVGVGLPADVGVADAGTSEVGIGEGLADAVPIVVGVSVAPALAVGDGVPGVRGGRGGAR